MAKKPVKKETKKAEKNEFEEQDELDQAKEESAELEGEEQHDPTDEDIENEEAQQDEVDAEPEQKVLTCPKCHAKYDEAKMEDKEAIVHGVRDAEGEIKVSYYCPPCALSWLERSSAKLA